MAARNHQFKFQKIFVYLPKYRPPRRSASVQNRSDRTEVVHPWSASLLLTSSPLDPATPHSSNQTFLAEISNSQLPTPVKAHARRLSGITERQQADNTILCEENRAMHKVQAKRRERETGKRWFLKGRPVISTEEAREFLLKSEKRTEVAKAKVGKKAKKLRRKHIRVVEDASETDSDDPEYLEPAMLDSIEVMI